MQKQKKSEQKTAKVADTNLEPRDISLEEPVPMPTDPGGAHTKGYSPDDEPDALTDGKSNQPIPLANAPEEGHVRQPEREGKVQPTGRSEPRDYSPNDRLMGSDR